MTERAPLCEDVRSEAYQAEGRLESVWMLEDSEVPRKAGTPRAGRRSRKGWVRTVGRA